MLPFPTCFEQSSQEVFHRWIQRDGPLESILPEFEPVKEVDPDILMQLAYFGFKPVETRAKVQDNVKCQEVTPFSCMEQPAHRMIDHHVPSVG